MTTCPAAAASARRGLRDPLPGDAAGRGPRLRPRPRSRAPGCEQSVFPGAEARAGPGGPDKARPAGTDPSERQGGLGAAGRSAGDPPPPGGPARGGAGRGTLGPPGVLTGTGGKARREQAGSGAAGRRGRPAEAGEAADARPDAGEPARARHERGQQSSCAAAGPEPRPPAETDLGVSVAQGHRAGPRGRGDTGGATRRPGRAAGGERTRGEESRAPREAESSRSRAARESRPAARTRPPPPASAPGSRWAEPELRGEAAELWTPPRPVHRLGVGPAAGPAPPPSPVPREEEPAAPGPAPAAGWPRPGPARGGARSRERRSPRRPVPPPPRSARPREEALSRRSRTQAPASLRSGGRPASSGGCGRQRRPGRGLRKRGCGDVSGAGAASCRAAGHGLGEAAVRSVAVTDVSAI